LVEFGTRGKNAKKRGEKGREARRNKTEPFLFEVEDPHPSGTRKRGNRSLNETVRWTKWGDA